MKVRASEAPTTMKPTPSPVSPMVSTRSLQRHTRPENTAATSHSPDSTASAFSASVGGHNFATIPVHPPETPILQRQHFNPASTTRQNLSLDPERPQEFLDKLKEFMDESVRQTAKRGGLPDPGHIEKVENALRQVKKAETEGKISKSILRSARNIVSKRGGPRMAEVLRKSRLRKVITRRLARLAESKTARRTASLVPLVGWAFSADDAWAGTKDMLAGHVKRGLTGITCAAADVASDFLHAGDAVSGVGGTIASLSLQAGTITCQVVLEIQKAKEKLDLLEQRILRGEGLPPDDVLRNQFELDQESIQELKEHLQEREEEQAGDAPASDNSANQQAIGPLQKKLTVNTPGDRYEQEADRVAEQVMRMSDSDASVQRKCTRCEEDERHVRRKAATTDANPGFVPPSVHKVLNSPGQPLDSATRDFFEPRFGHDFSNVRVHTDEAAGESARAVNARAYTVGRDVVFGAGHYRPHTFDGRGLLAHELTHVLQQQATASEALQRYGASIPIVEKPSVRTMAEYIQLVRKIESFNPGLSALQVAQMLMRTKYHSLGFDYVLPSSAGGAQVAPSHAITGEDVTTLTGEFDVELPGGEKLDASHVVTGIVATAEAKPAGAAGFPGQLVPPIPTGLSQRSIVTWVGDVALAAAKWMSAAPSSTKGSTQQDHMEAEAPESDLIADIDGIAIASSSASTGFVFDSNASLSSNLQRYYFPANSREGKNRRFHSFCAIEGFAIDPSGKLTVSAIKAIDERIRLNAEWFQRADLDLLTYTATTSDGIKNPIRDARLARQNDWRWFSQKFREFLERNLQAEGP